MLGALVAPALPANALPTYLTAFETNYPAAAGSRIDSCNLCHSSVPQLNPYGLAFANAGFAFAPIEAADSDGDGASNLAEIMALTFPGNASDVPVLPTPTPTTTATPPLPTATQTATATTRPPTATPSATNSPALTATATATPPVAGTATATPVVTATAPSTPLVTATATSTSLETATATATPLVTATGTEGASCVGDCNGNGFVTIDELVKAVNVALGTASASVCLAADPDGDGVSVAELVRAVNAALKGC